MMVGYRAIPLKLLVTQLEKFLSSSSVALPDAGFDQLTFLVARVLQLL